MSLFKSINRVLKYQIASYDISQKLLLACKYNKRRSVILDLLDRGANVNVERKSKYYKYTPLVHACNNNNTRVAFMLIDNGANIYPSYKRPLAIAIGHGNIELFNKLINEAKRRNIFRIGHDYLEIACRKGRIDMVEILIDNGVKLNGYRGRSPALIQACKNDNTIIAKKLIECGANINMDIQKKVSPLAWACENNNIEVVIALLEAGANVNDYVKRCSYKTSYFFYGATPLQLACYYNHTELAIMFINAGANVNAHLISRDNETSLYLACCRSNNIRLSIKLIENGARITNKIILDTKNIHFKNFLILRQKRPDIQTECSICLDEFEHGQTLTILQTGQRNKTCDHVFHTECILEWLERNNVCPLCRFNVTDEHYMRTITYYKLKYNTYPKKINPKDHFCNMELYVSNMKY